MKIKENKIMDKYFDLVKKPKKAVKNGDSDIYYN